jgi:arylsulfatase
MYRNGWIPSTTPLRLPSLTFGAASDPDEFKWELYNIAEDFSQADNLAARNPAKLEELQQLFALGSETRGGSSGLG